MTARASLAPGRRYTRVQVQEAIGVENPTHQGAWGTGYVERDGEFFVFVNIGVAGRTGHDYDNEWDGEDLIWSAKGGTTLEQPAIRRLLAPGTPCHIFVRNADRAPFLYWGVGLPRDPAGSRPVRLRWVFAHDTPRANAAVGSNGEGHPDLQLHGAYRSAARPQVSQGSSARQVGLAIRNPALAERALAGHADTQDGLAAVLLEAGYEPLSPEGPVDYDLAWKDAARLAVAEVKSLTEVNEIAQLRQGIGQLLDYAAELEDLGEVVGRLLLVAERRPSNDKHWHRVSQRAGVDLTWAPGFPGLLDGG